MLGQLAGVSAVLLLWGVGFKQAGKLRLPAGIGSREVGGVPACQGHCVGAGGEWSMVRRVEEVSVSLVRGILEKHRNAPVHLRPAQAGMKTQGSSFPLAFQLQVWGFGT